MGGDIEQLVDQAWAEAFEPGPNNFPAALASTDGSAAPDASYTNGAIDICTIPWSGGGGPSPDGDATVRCTGMKISGLGAATSGGAPTFASQDTLVTFPLKVASFQINGSFDITQPCCSAWFFWCVLPSTAEETNTFTMTVSNSSLNVTCALSPPPTPAVVVQGVSIAFGGVSLSIPSADPSWLSWMDDLFNATSGIKSAIQASAAQILGSPPLKSQLQTAFNNLLGSGEAPVAAVTPDSMQQLLAEQGLPPFASPRGLLQIHQADDGLRLEQEYGVWDIGGSSRWQGTLTVAASAAAANAAPAAGLTKLAADAPLPPGAVSRSPAEKHAAKA